MSILIKRFLTFWKLVTCICDYQTFYATNYTGSSRTSAGAVAFFPKITYHLQQRVNICNEPPTQTQPIVAAFYETHQIAPEANRRRYYRWWGLQKSFPSISGGRAPVGGLVL